MGFMNNLDIAVSGMIAERARMDVIAQNVANADTTRTAKGGPYVRQNVVFTENVMPEFGRLNTEPVNAVIREMFIGRITEDDMKCIREAAGRALKAAEEIVSHGVDSAMNIFNHG